MSTGVLLYCSNTPTYDYHRVAERCVELIKKNLKLEITIVTDAETYKKFKPLGFINYKLIDFIRISTKHKIPMYYKILFISSI